MVYLFILHSTSEKAFGNVLKHAFRINTTEADYKKTMRDYTSRMHEFHQDVLYYNAWIKCLRAVEKGKQERICLEHKITKYFHTIAIDQPIQYLEELGNEWIKTKYPNAPIIDVDSISKCIELFRKANLQQIFRGHYEMQFFIKILEDLVNKNRDGTYFQVKRKCVRFNPNQDPLLLFSSDAETPDSLVDFLMQYMQKM